MFGMTSMFNAITMKQDLYIWYVLQCDKPHSVVIYFATSMPSFTSFPLHFQNSKWPTIIIIIIITIKLYFYYTFHTGGVTQSALQQSEVIKIMSEQISSKQVQILHHKNQTIK